MKNTGMYYLYVVNGTNEIRLSDDNQKLSSLLGKDGQVPDLRLRRITLSYKPSDGAMKLDSIFYMAVNNVVEGKHPLTQEEAITMAAQQVQAIYGDYDPSHLVVTPQNLATFVAPFFLNDGLIDKVNKAHSKMFGQSATGVKMAYLEKVSTWPLSGASLFAVQQPRKSPKNVLFTVDEDTVTILAPPAMVHHLVAAFYSPHIRT
jgi:hypothetical protein